MEDVARFSGPPNCHGPGPGGSRWYACGGVQAGGNLKRAGLGLPQVTELMHELKAKGMAVDTDVLTVEAAEEEIVKALGGQR